MESSGICKSTETFFSFRLCNAIRQFKAVSTVSFGASAVSASITCTWVLLNSTLFSTAFSFFRSMPWLSRKNRPSVPLMCIPSSKVEEFTATCCKVISSTSTLPCNKGHACTRTFRLPRFSRVSGCCTSTASFSDCTTCTPRTSRFKGKRRSIRSTEIFMPVASDAIAVACFRIKFCTGGTYSNIINITNRIIGVSSTQSAPFNHFLLIGTSNCHLLKVVQSKQLISR